MNEVQGEKFNALGLASDGYLRERQSPSIGDTLYLHLSDLLLFMKQLEIDPGSRILDFGSGGSPYRQFFPDCEYRTADIMETNHPDYIISKDGIINEIDGHFDVIFSTQVAEHVEYYREYIKECRRLLRPDGKLILTVPGMYEEHACPGDYQRWMVQGIRRDVIGGGFTVERVTKLTVGPRAIFFFFDRFLDTMQSSRKTFAGASLFVARALLFPFRSSIHWIVDHAYSDFRLVESEGETDSFYLGLAVEARKNSL